MAKVPFSKLQANINECKSQISYINKAGEEIIYEVRHYLPFEEKLELVSKIINQSVDDNGFYNPMRVKFYMVLEIIYAYTNLSFTPKMKENPLKLYDILISSGIFTNVIDIIKDNDWNEIQESVWSTIDNIYNYKNSVMGILDVIVDDYNGLSLEAADIQEKLSNSDNLALLKDVLSKLG